MKIPKSTDGISVIIPAYNEAPSLLEAVGVVTDIVSKETNNYEIIIINDGSTDDTGKIADKLASKYKHIIAIHHKTNIGFGKTFRDGITIASKKYITGFPADNDLLKESFQDIITARKNNTLVITYSPDMSERELVRQFISAGYTKIMNIAFGLHLKYYNGYFISPSNAIKQLTLKSEGFTLFAEIKIKLIRKGIAFIEIPYECGLRKYGTSKAFTPKGIFQTIRFIPSIVRDIYFSHEITQK